MKALTCPNCNAPVSKLSNHICEYCGSMLVLEDTDIKCVEHHTEKTNIKSDVGIDLSTIDLSNCVLEYDKIIRYAEYFEYIISFIVRPNYDTYMISDFRNRIRFDYKISCDKLDIVLKDIERQGFNINNIINIGKLHEDFEDIFRMSE